MLILPIKKKWFDMIKSGKKTEEYREMKPYYSKRLVKKIDNQGCIEIVLRNGYSRNSPALKCKCRFAIKKGRKEWGAEPGVYYYAFEILSKEEI